MSIGQVPTVQVKTLKHFLNTHAKECLHPAAGLLKKPFVTPTWGINPGADDEAEIAERSLIGHYLQMYDWDSTFFCQAAYKAGINDLPCAVVDNFVSLQATDGFIPRTISPHRIWDQGDMCKPFLAQTLLYHWQHSQQKGTSKDTTLNLPLNELNKYLIYFQHHRLHTSGLYHWKNVLESGVDNNLALLAPQEAAKDESHVAVVFPDGRLLAVDLNSYLVAEFRAFSKLAKAFGDNDLSIYYLELADSLLAKIEELLWNEKLGMYCNLDPQTNEHVAVRSWTGLTPVLLDLAYPERIQQTIEGVILNEAHFFRPHGLSSLAASEPLYNQARRGLYGRAIVSNWQGPVWVLPNALTVRCLLAHGYRKEARELAQRVVLTLIQSLDTTNNLYESYNAETGAPIWAPHFMSWNILALELIQLLE